MKYIIIVFVLISVKAIGQEDSIYNFVKQDFEKIIQYEKKHETVVELYKNRRFYYTDSIKQTYLVNIITNSNYGVSFNGVNKLIYIGKNSPFKTNRQKILNHLLNVCRSPGRDVGEVYNFKPEDFDSTARQRIVELINGRYSDEENIIIHNYRKNDYIKHFDDQFIEYRIDDAIKKTNKSRKEIRDSILEYELNLRFGDTLKIVRYPKSLFHIAGKFYIYEAVPELETLLKKLEKNKKKYDDKIFAIKKALARLGNKKCANQVTDSLINFIKIVDIGISNYDEILYSASYICNNKSAEVYKAILQSNYKYICLYGKEEIASAHLVPGMMKVFFLNYPYSYYTNRYPCKKSDVIKESIQKSINWLNKNKGNYKLNKYCQF